MVVVFIFNLEDISYINISIIDFEQVNVSWMEK